MSYGGEEACPPPPAPLTRSCPAGSCANSTTECACPPGWTSRADFNRDGRVNALDLAVVRQNFRHSLTPPPAPTSPARLARVTVEVLSDDDTVPADTR